MGENVEGVYESGDVDEVAFENRDPAELRLRHQPGDLGRGRRPLDTDDPRAGSHHVGGAVRAELRDAGDERAFGGLTDALDLPFTEEILQGIALARNAGAGTARNGTGESCH